MVPSLPRRRMPLPPYQVISMPAILPDPRNGGGPGGRAGRRPVRLLPLAFSVLLGACSATAPSPSPLSTSVPTLAPTEGPTPTPALSPGSSGGALGRAMGAAIAGGGGGA